MQAKNSMKSIIDSFVELQIRKNTFGEKSVKLWKTYLEAGWVKPKEVVEYMQGELTVEELSHKMSKRQQLSEKH